MTGIPLTSKNTIPFTPKSIELALIDPTISDEYRARLTGVSFEIRVPNYADQDQLGLRQYRMGVIPVTAEQVRALMLSECFTVLGDIRGEEEATFLETHWQQMELDEQDQRDWWAQENQRLIDVAQIPDGVPKPEQAPPVVPRVTVKDRARAAIVAQKVMDESPAMRNKMVEQQLYEPANDIALARLHIKAVRGLPITTNIAGGLMDEESIEAIRDALARLVGAVGWIELCTEIKSLYNLPEIERGNSVSPLENTTAESGSLRTSGELGDSAGSIPTTTSSTGPTPADGSPTTTETSSRPSRAAAGKKARKGGRTAAR